MSSVLKTKVIDIRIHPRKKCLAFRICFRAENKDDLRSCKPPIFSYCTWTTPRLTDGSADSQNRDWVCWMNNHSDCAVDFDNFIDTLRKSGVEFSDKDIQDIRQLLPIGDPLVRTREEIDTLKLWAIIVSTAILFLGPNLITRLSGCDWAKNVSSFIVPAENDHEDQQTSP